MSDIEQLQKKLLKMAEEAIALRYEAGDDPEGPLTPLDTTASYTEVMHELYRTRMRADRIEHLMAKVTQVRGRLRRNRNEKKFEADMRHAAAMRENSARRSFESFSSAKERDSEASLDSFEQLRESHQAAKILDVADECHEVISKLYWQLSDIRKDLRALLHALEFQSTLEH